MCIDPREATLFFESTIVIYGIYPIQNKSKFYWVGNDRVLVAYICLTVRNAIIKHGKDVRFET